VLFRQLFERDSSTYTYLLAARPGGEALLIDPVRSEVGKYLQLIEELAHDYKGSLVSTIGEEKAHNPRLQVRSEREYVELMRGLKLSNPKLMDIAVPANLACGVA
jgi:hypothetical protein